MDGYRMTFDASAGAKVKGGSAGHARMWLHHIARDLDDAEGTPRAHRNERIDRSRTQYNLTVVPGPDGEMVPVRSVRDLEDRLGDRLQQVHSRYNLDKAAEVVDTDDRLAAGVRRLKDDSVIIRPIVCNLSKEWFEEHNPDWRENGLNAETWAAYGAMWDHAVEVFGAENIVVGSVHMDEDLPQWQIGVCPVAGDRLSQKTWWSGPTAMAAMGVGFREAVAATGVDVDMVPAEDSKVHRSAAEYKRDMDRLTRDQAAVDQEASDLSAERMEFNRTVTAHNQAMREDRQKTSAAKEAADVLLAQAQADADAAAAARQAQEAALARAEEREAAAEKREQSARDLRATMLAEQRADPRGHARAYLEQTDQWPKFVAFVKRREATMAIGRQVQGDTGRQAATPRLPEQFEIE